MSGTSILLPPHQFHTPHHDTHPFFAHGARCCAAGSVLHDHVFSPFTAFCLPEVPCREHPKHHSSRVHGFGSTSVPVQRHSFLNVRVLFWMCVLRFRPRSEPNEVIDGVSLPSYRGDIINSEVFSEEARRNNPWRMLDAYHQSTQTLNILRCEYTCTQY